MIMMIMVGWCCQKLSFFCEFHVEAQTHIKLIICEYETIGSANGKSFSFYRLYLQFIRNHNIFDGSKSIFWWFFFSQEWITKLGVTSWRKIILHLIKWMHFILGYTGIFGKCVVFHSNFDWNKNSIPPKKATRTSCGVNAIPCVQFRKFEWNTYEKKAHIQIRAKKQT